MSRSYKRVIKLGVNDREFKVLSNKIYRRQSIIDKNGDEIISGKNKTYNKYTINTWAICDYKGRFFTKKKIQRFIDYTGREYLLRMK